MSGVNKSMGTFPRSRRRDGLKLAGLILAVCVGAGTEWLLLMHFAQHKITDKELLREAVAEWRCARESGYGPNPQIFEQQATQGYYDDAAATAHLFSRPDDVQWSVVELAKIRAENGDIAGAKAAIGKFAGSELGTRATRVIASVQASSGDLAGALQTAAPFGDLDEVLLIFARRQIAKGDFDGALRTAEQMKSKSVDDVFYELGDALRLRGEQKRVHQLAAHMSDRRLSALFIKLVPLTLWPREPDVVERVTNAAPCDAAAFDAFKGKYPEADALLEQNKCDYVVYVAVEQYAFDPVGAERLLRSAINRQDLAFGLDQFAATAARKGNIAEALRFLKDLQSLSPGAGDKSVQEIARAWTIRDGPRAVLKWARSRPTTDQRTWALIGMAEALGHARRG